MSVPGFNFSFLASPSFWTGVITSADRAVELGSPNYTKAKHFADTVARALGLPVVDVPDAAAAESVGKAIADGVHAGAAQIAAAVASAQKTE